METGLGERGQYDAPVSAGIQHRLRQDVGEGGYAWTLMLGDLELLDDTTPQLPAAQENLP